MPAETKEVILDAAEVLIAERGIDAVSLRSIIKAAHVNLAAVHYHFGSKEALVRKVFERRLRPLNEERIAKLVELDRRAGDGPLVLEEVLRALIEPAFRLWEAHERGRMFLRMCGRFYADPAPYLEPTFRELFRDLITRLRSAFARALPEAPEEERAWGVHFAVGAMIHTMLESGRLKSFSRGLLDLSDTNLIIERLIRFSAAGLRAAIPTTENSSPVQRVVNGVGGPHDD